MSLVPDAAGHARWLRWPGPPAPEKANWPSALAAAFRGEIVNCDSLQVYRHFDIGTAKLPPDERRGIPHHLIDILDPDDLFTAGEYARLAREAIAGISARGKPPHRGRGHGLLPARALGRPVRRPRSATSRCATGWPPGKRRRPGSLAPPAYTI